MLLRKYLKNVDDLIDRIPKEFQDIIIKGAMALAAIFALIGIYIGIRKGTTAAQPQGTQMARDTRDLFSDQIQKLQQKKFNREDRQKQSFEFLDEPTPLGPEFMSQRFRGQQSDGREKKKAVFLEPELRYDVRDLAQSGGQSNLARRRILRPDDSYRTWETPSPAPGESGRRILRREHSDLLSNEEAGSLPSLRRLRREIRRSGQGRNWSGERQAIARPEGTSLRGETLSGEAETGSGPLAPPVEGEAARLAPVPGRSAGRRIIRRGNRKENPGTSSGPPIILDQSSASSPNGNAGPTGSATGPAAPIVLGQ